MIDKFPLTEEELANLRSEQWIFAEPSRERWIATLDQARAELERAQKYVTKSVEIVDEIESAAYERAAEVVDGWVCRHKPASVQRTLGDLIAADIRALKGAKS